MPRRLRRSPDQASTAGKGEPWFAPAFPKPARWVVAALLVSGLCAHAATYGDWIVDDAAITFAYAKNLVAGYGLTANPGVHGAPIEGYSNPLWLALCALAMALRLFHPVWFPKIVGVLFTAGALWLAVDLVRRLSGRPIGWLHMLAPALLLANGSVVAWNVSGLESAQMMCCVLLALVLYARDVARPQRFPASGWAMAAVALTRPEGLMYVCAIGADAVVRAVAGKRWRWIIGLTLSVAAPLALYVLWHLWYFDALLPNTYYAKSHSAGGSLFTRLVAFGGPGWRYLGGAFADWRLTWLLVPAGIAVAHRRALARGLVPVLFTLLGSAFFVLVVGGDWMMQYRLLHPLFPALAVLAAVGLVTLAQRLQPRFGSRATIVAGIAAVAGLAFNVAALPAQHRNMTTAPNPTMPMSFAVPFASAFAASVQQMQHIPQLRQQSPLPVAVSAFGAPAWLNSGQMHLIDLAGLNDRFIARAGHQQRAPSEVCHYVFVKRRPVLVQFAPFVQARWRLSQCSPFRQGYARYDIAGQRGRDLSGVYIRRDIIEAPWEDAFAEPAPTAGPLRIHRIAHDAPRDGRLPLHIWFSVSRPLTRPPRAPLFLRAQDRRSIAAKVTLLRVIQYPAIRPDTVYVHHGPLRLPPGWTRVEQVRPRNMAVRPTGLHP